MRRIRWVLYLLIALAPGIVTVLLLSSQLNAKLTDFHPAWSDEVLYWQQINSYQGVGINGGNFTFEEQLADSGSLQYGTHGPVFTMFYGGLARVFGWSLYAGVFFNLVLLSIALFVALWLIKPDNRQSILILLLVGLSYPVLYFAPTLMQESLQYAIAILLGGIMIRWAKDEKPSRLIKIIAVAIVVFASLIRISWVVVFFPVVYFLKDTRSKRWALLSVGISILLSISMYLLFNYWTSPYPDWFFYQVLTPSATIFSKIGVLFAHAIENIKNYFSFGEPSQKIEILFRYQYLLLIVILAVMTRKKSKVVITALFLLVSSLLIVIVLYDVTRFRDYRFLSPFLLMGLLFFIGEIKMAPRWTQYLAYIYLLTNILSIGFFLTDYHQTHANEYGKNWDPLGDVYTDTITSIKFSENADPWCNSLLTTHISGENYKHMAPGIGLNIVMDPERMIGNIRSHYIFVPPETIEDWGLADSCKVLFADTENVICERTDDVCP